MNELRVYGKGSVYGIMACWLITKKYKTPKKLSTKKHKSLKRRSKSVRVTLRKGKTLQWNVQSQERTKLEKEIGGVVP